MISWQDITITVHFLKGVSFKQHEEFQNCKYLFYVNFTIMEFLKLSFISLDSKYLYGWIFYWFSWFRFILGNYILTLHSWKLLLDYLFSKIVTSHFVITMALSNTYLITVLKFGNLSRFVTICNEFFFKKTKNEFVNSSCHTL